MGNKAKMLEGIGKFLTRLGLAPGKLPGYRYLLRRLSPFVGDLTVEFESLRISGSLWHRHDLWAMQRGTYEPFATQLFKEVVKNGMVVCDIGAQIGYYTLLAAWNVGQQGQVYAFEPDPRSFSYLIRNIEQNGLSKVVVPVNKAESNRGGTVMLYLDEIDARGSSLFRHPHVGKRVSVEALILDEFFPKHIGVDVVKIDAEGSELLVLESMERLLGRTKQIKLFVECNPFMLKIAGSSVEELTSKLRSHGFNIKIIDERARKLVEADPNYIYAYANSETKVPAYRGWAVMLYCVRS